MQVSGKVRMIGQTQQVTDSFKKRDLVVTTDEQYPQHILIEFAQDKCDILNGYKAGDSVNISINLRGREWVNPQGETKYFNSIQGWRIERMQAEVQQYQQPQQYQQAPPQQFQQPTTQSFQQEYPDDLPFN